MPRRSARDLFMLKAPTDKRLEWFKIQNAADDSDTTEIYIYDEIGGWWGVDATEFVNQLRRITTSKIKVHINSPGGDVFDGVAIYNALRSHDAEVTTIVDALAASAASYIAQAGDIRLMTRNATMMIHDASGMTYGNAQDHEDMASLLDRVSNNIADIYASVAGGKVEDWRALMKAETWYSAQEAVDAGLASDVLDYTDSKAEEAKNAWDFSIFNYRGRENAPSPLKMRELIRLSNQTAKENIVGRPKNEGDEPGTAEQAPTTPPATTQPQTTSEGSPNVPAEDDEQTGGEQQTPDPEAGQGDTGAGQSATDKATAHLANKAASAPVLVNGAQVTDLQVIQNHILVLEQFRKDTVENGRKEFVENLAKENKLAATQVEATQKLVLNLNDEQYEMWRASWEAAPSLPLFGSHAQGHTNLNGQPSSEDAAKAEKISVLEAVVEQHRKGGMAIDKIEKLPSYTELKQLKPEFTLA